MYKEKTKNRKKLAPEIYGYRYKKRTNKSVGFHKTRGNNLKENNGWEKAQTISWLDIEKRYAKLFTNRKGNVARTLHLVARACIVQTE